MPVKDQAAILEKLSSSADRMLTIRRAAQLATIIREGGEPAATPTSGLLAQPGAPLVGEPPRSSAPAR